MDWDLIISVWVSKIFSKFSKGASMAIVVKIYSVVTLRYKKRRAIDKITNSSEDKKIFFIQYQTMSTHKGYPYKLSTEPLLKQS